MAASLYEYGDVPIAFRVEPVFRMSVDPAGRAMRAKTKVFVLT